MKTKKQKKLTYKEMLAVLGEFRKEVLIMRNEMSSIHFLINSLLEMNGDVERLTDFIEGKVEKLSSKEGVICSGAWSHQIFKAIPIFPVKGQMLSLQGPKEALKRIIFGPGTYLVPREDGLIVIGATNEKEAGFDSGLTPAGQQQLHKGIEALLPKANKWPQMERWWGFRPCTPDESPLIGASRLEGLWLATGHHRNGVLLAAITAQMISQSICNERLKSEEEKLLNQFHWKRFQLK